MLSDFALKTAELFGMDWAWWLKETAETLVEVGLNFFRPGYGSIVNFGEALYEFSKGNTTDGFANVGYGLLNIATVGLSNILLKKFMQNRVAQGIPSIIFQKLLGDSGKMTLMGSLHNYFMNIFSCGGLQFKEPLIHSTLEIGFTRFFERLFDATKKDLICVTMLPIMRELQREVNKYARMRLFLNYCCACGKGFIKIQTQSPTKTE